MTDIITMNTPDIDKLIADEDHVIRAELIRLNKVIDLYRQWHEEDLAAFEALANIRGV